MKCFPFNLHLAFVSCRSHAPPPCPALTAEAFRSQRKAPWLWMAYQHICLLRRAAPSHPVKDWLLFIPGFRSPTRSGHSSASGRHKSDPGGTVSVTDQCQIISRGWPRKKYPKQDTFNCLGASTSGRCVFLILRAAGVSVLSECCPRNSLSGSPVVIVLRRDFLCLSYFELNYLPLYAQAFSVGSHLDSRSDLASSSVRNSSHCIT